MCLISLRYELQFNNVLISYLHMLKRENILYVIKQHYDEMSNKSITVIVSSACALLEPYKFQMVISVRF